ncbi:hypothetical protein CLOM_g9468 [Closterium sp. NIES-68]|nr:hypothetical protein CLOM_g9468 [Closterium sp. NIES-68]
MVLEATVVCVDNSEWMRNGDYAPSRFQAQSDAINLICGAKTQSNPENTVGILTMAGKGVRVLVTPTADLGKILSTMHGLEVGGDTNLLSGLQVAQLALKHRQNKNQRQRIVLFIGSPVPADTDTLVKAGKRLKKNSVAPDIPGASRHGHAGEGGQAPEEEQRGAGHRELRVGGGGRAEAGQAGGAARRRQQQRQLPPRARAAWARCALGRAHQLPCVHRGWGGRQWLRSSSSRRGSGSSGSRGGGLGGDFDFGVDPSVDPELALALRVSMEEERARQEAAARKAAEQEAAGGGGGGAGGSGGEGGGEGEGGKGDVAMGEGERKADEGRATAAAAAADVAMDDEAALLQQALAMSMAAAAAGGAGDAAMLDAAAGGEDAELALALQLSMQEAAEEGKKEAAAAEVGAAGDASTAAAAAGAPGDVDMSQVLGDASFVNSILSSLPGVDPNDPSVRDVLASLAPSQPPKDSEEKPKEDK